MAVGGWQLAAEVRTDGGREDAKGQRPGGGFGNELSAPFTLAIVNQRFLSKRMGCGYRCIRRFGYALAVVDSDTFGREAPDARDVVGYAYVRRGFLAGLAADEGFAALLGSWAVDAGVWDAAGEAAAQLEEIEGRGRDAGWDVAAGLHLVMAEFEARLDAFLKGGWEAELGLILEERELTAGWLSELVKDACFGAVNTLRDTTEAPEPGVLIRKAVGREIELLDRSLEDAGEAEVMGERRRVSYEQYGRWLYLSAIQEQPKRIIARASLGSVNQTSQVRYGLRRAREFLAMGEAKREAPAVRPRKRAAGTASQWD